MAKNSGIVILGLLGLAWLVSKKNGGSKNGWTPATGWNQGARWGGYRGSQFYDLGTQGGYNAWVRDAGRAYTGGLDLGDGTIEGGGIPIPSDYDQVERRRLTPRTHPVENPVITLNRQARQRSTKRIYDTAVRQAQLEAGGIRKVGDVTLYPKIPESQDYLEQRRL